MVKSSARSSYRVPRSELAIAASPTMGEFLSKQSTAMKLCVPPLTTRRKHKFKARPQALRLVLNSLSTSASRYGRYITPLLSLSIDFYVRLFIQVKSAPIEVKRAARFATFTLYREPADRQWQTAKLRRTTYAPVAKHSTLSH